MPVALATSRTVEAVAALIWLGNFDADVTTLFQTAGPKASPRCQAVRRRLTDFSLIELFQVLLPVVAVEDVAAYDLRPSAVAQTGARILRLLASVAVGKDECGTDIARTLQEGWVPHEPAAAQLIRTAADPERRS